MICSSAISPSPPFSDASLRLQCIITCPPGRALKCRFFSAPPSGRRERGNQGTPLKPRQGPRPWTPLTINLLRRRKKRGNQGTPLKPHQGRGDWTPLTINPLRQRKQRGNQGTPLKPRQGPRPWTPLTINLLRRRKKRGN